MLQVKAPWRNPSESVKTWTLPETVSLYTRGDSRWNVPMRSALNNFSIRWKFLSFQQFQKLRSSWMIAVFCKCQVRMRVKFKGINTERELRQFISKCLKSLTVVDNVFLLNWFITGICGNNLSVCRKTTQIHKQRRGFWTTKCTIICEGNPWLLNVGWNLSAQKQLPFLWRWIIRTQRPIWGEKVF